MNWFAQGLYSTALILWQTFWAIVMGYGISSLLVVYVRPQQMTKYFGKANLRSMGAAIFLGAASSSCSYAATAAAKNAFRKGAALPVALAFMFASTNLVVELSALIWVFMGGLFVLAEFVGAFVLVGVMWGLTRWVLPRDVEAEARKHSGEKEEKGCHGEFHGMPNSGANEKQTGWLPFADAFCGELSMVWKEILGGFLFSGFLMALVPLPWWQKLFISDAPYLLRLVENAMVGPLIAFSSFVCSEGNIPLAGWLWSNGISFSGVISFVYADLIILPLILIYRKYYGGRAAIWISLVLFLSMVISGVLMEFFFNILGLLPSGPRPPSPLEMAHFEWNYTTWLDIPALLLVAWLFLLYFRRGKKAHSCCAHG